MKKSNYTDQEIITSYQEGNYLRAIEKQYHIDMRTIKNILNKNNIEYNKKIYRKHIINEKYFDNIDSEDKAYFLGLLFADGCVAKNGYNICLTLKNNDKHIL